jgi:hypothetical protein
MSTPYNTGKVRIGLYYSAPKPTISDHHMERVQSALLRPSKRVTDCQRAELRHIAMEAVFWTASAALFMGILYAPQIWGYLFNS